MSKCDLGLPQAAVHYMHMSLNEGKVGEAMPKSDSLANYSLIT